MPLPYPAGLYDPAFEHDACGLGFVAELRRSPSHDVLKKALEVLRRLSHRGAAGADPDTGDGCGVLLQLPHAFFERELAHQERDLPLPGDYGVAMCFLSREPGLAAEQMAIVEEAARHHGQKVIAWRDVPLDLATLGPVARSSRPTVRQLFIGRMSTPKAFERVLFMIRKRAGRLGDVRGKAEGFYIASLSSQTVVYKGLMLPGRLADAYVDLKEDDVRTSLAVVHSRFSTNTFPTWERAHPYRRIAHNGEINTLRGNQNWMGAREGLLASEAFGEYIDEFKPIVRPGGSDSASLDNVVDFLVAGGRSLPHVMMMLVPEAWATQADMPPEKRAFYEYHGHLVEPWDGPAALVFTDGTKVGATLDRNGLRPAKYVVTQGGLVVLASELGVLDFDPADVLEKGRLQPGKMFLVDTAAGRIVGDDDVKRSVATAKPYGEWLAAARADIGELKPVEGTDGPAALYTMEKDERERLQRAFGYTREDLRTLLTPMAETGEEPVGSMGCDVPLAVLSRRPVPLFRYFKQQFAQVTNPPIDPIREELVMSLVTCVGGEGNLLDETPEHCRLLSLPHPILTNEELAHLKREPFPRFPVRVLPALFTGSMQSAIDELCARAEAAVDEGASVLVVTDRGVDGDHVAIPSLLAVAAAHHHLIRAGKRARCGLVVESGDAREVADVALLVGYGAGAVNPYLALETLRSLGLKGDGYVKALKKGLLKVMSKMGISCLSSYHGAQIFEALGLHEGLVARHFAGTPSRLGGLRVEDLEREARARHESAFAKALSAAELADEGTLPVGGDYAWRVGGETHLWTPEVVAGLQKAVRLGDGDSYEDFARRINEPGDDPVTLRALWDLVSPGDATEVPLAEVEPAARIVRRFCTGAMSFGSISKEAHETLALAMNRVGGRSNTGEGGEDEERFADGRRSAIKQVASGRFGVSAHYLVNADEIQIKVAQGAKPGEGGQLPGPKVDAVIARVRHSTPGVTLISPPPHHDIYSIEDLAQLIFDLKSVSPKARISVKLVAEAGVGTVAAGVAKAHADKILIAGHDGGTGASPLSSIHRAGTPWELGLAEAQQVLVKNGLRGRVRLEADGQLRTGRDVAFAALLGAEEFGFATAPLVAAGCVMMRKCHLNTCPVGVATQDPVLRARFKGTPEHVINYFFFVAEELRRIMARLGFRTVDEMVGRVDCVKVRQNVSHPKARLLDFSRVLLAPEGDGPLRNVEVQDHGLALVLDHTLIRRARASLETGEPSLIALPIKNENRAFGAMLAGEIARRYGAKGLRDGTVTVDAAGTAGQSFGAFAVRGMTLSLEGDANDYVGKGLSGGILAVRPPMRAAFRADANWIVGNTVLYGAIAGKAFFAGRAGERFAVRNSGAVAVVEGVGDHGCEYMTGGTVVVLGTTGRNFAAGMSGGVAYVLDEDGRFAERCNKALVELTPLLAPRPEDDAGAFEEARAEETIVLELLEEHVARTGSVKGEMVLQAWDRLGPRFVKVMPTDYKRALAEQKAAQKTGAAVAAGGVTLRVVR